MSHFLLISSPKCARENKMNRSSSFEDSVHVTENFLRPKSGDSEDVDALDEIDTFLTEYVRLFDQGLLEKKNESESLVDGEEFVSGTYFWPKKTKTKEEDEEDKEEEERVRVLSLLLLIIKEWYYSRSNRDYKKKSGLYIGSVRWRRERCIWTSSIWTWTLRKRRRGS